MDRVFFTNSGTESIEGAIKLAKKYAYLKTGRTDSEIIAMHHSFHGRSMGALAVTGNKHYQEAFGPMIPGIKFANYNDLESVKQLVNDKTCAIIFETVQGEGGIYPATNEFIKGVRQLCDEKVFFLYLMKYSVEWEEQVQCLHSSSMELSLIFLLLPRHLAVVFSRCISCQGRSCQALVPRRSRYNLWR